MIGEVRRKNAEAAAKAAGGDEEEFGGFDD